MVTTVALIALMVLSFYFLILRPGRKRQQEQAKTMQALVPGARVLLASGVYGTLISKSDQEAVVEIAPGVRVEVVSRAIVQVVPTQAQSNPNPVASDQAGSNSTASDSQDRATSVDDANNAPGTHRSETGRDNEPPAGGTDHPQR